MTGAATSGTAFTAPTEEVATAKAYRAVGGAPDLIADAFVHMVNAFNTDFHSRPTGKEISLTDTGGSSSCSGTGTYKFKLSGSTLTFTKVKDTKSCVGRQGVLSHPFTKVS